MTATSTAEHELKLTIDDDFALPELGNPLPSRVFVSTYYDTEDLVLGRLGLTLRRRLENGKNLWQLKLPREGHRLELEIPGAPAGPPSELADLLLGVLRGRQIAAVAELRTRRESLRVESGRRRVADVVLDTVAVLDGQRVTREFRELEVEGVDGDSRGLEEIARELRRAGAQESDGRPKVFQTLGIVEESSPQPDASGSEHLRFALRTHVRSLTARDPGVRLGEAPEDVHQMRVSARRLRAILRAAEDSLDDEWTQGLTAELKWLGSLLGGVRDLDVLIAELEKIGTKLEGDGEALRSLIESFAAEREQARRTLLDELSGGRYLSLLDSLDRAAESPRFRSEPDLPAVAQAAFRRLRRAVHSVGAEPSDEQLHDLRIRGKRARYAAELAAPALGRPAERLVGRAKSFQDAIGAHQDAVVAEERLRALLAGAPPRVAFAAGRLVELQRARRLDARRGWPKTWKKLERSGRRAFG